ncbi:hypothetical protein ACVITL_000086 [Rhizobium pisi]
MAGREVGHDRAAEAERIDAEMRIEAPVFDGNDGFRNIGRHVFERQRLAAGGAAIGDDAAVDGSDLDVRRPFRDRPRAGARHARAVIEHKPGNADAGPDEKHDAPVDHAAQESENTAAFALPWLAPPSGGGPLRRGLGTATRRRSASNDAIVRIEREFVIVACRAAAEGRFDSVA